MSERLVGVDPSLSSTGFAIITRTEDVVTEHHTIPGKLILTTITIKPAGATPRNAVEEVERVQEIVDQVCKSSHHAVAVYVESPALASRTGKALERAHLYFSLVAAFHARRVPVTTVAPTTLKKRITGSGRADKDAVISVVRHAWSSNGWSDGAVGGRSDRADATGLAWMAALDHGWDVPLPAQRLQLGDAA